MAAVITLTSAAQAAYIVGNIDFGGGTVGLQKANGTAVGSTDSFVGTAAKLDFVTGSTVNIADGTFTGLTGSAVVFNQDPWTFAPLSTGNLWTVGGFTFDVKSVAVSGNFNALEIIGTGTVSATGYDTSSGEWVLTTQRTNGSNRSTFSWSSSATSVPDGGATVALFGLSLLGLTSVRRFVK